MRSGKYRGRLKGIVIRSDSVRQARLEAGLTLEQVAAGKVTRTAIYFIETGRTSPSRETLRLIARQTHKPIAYFLDTSAVPSKPTEAIEDSRV
jgi:transcriptional regulator with XRE-family HTH domain